MGGSVSSSSGIRRSYSTSLTFGHKKSETLDYLRSESDIRKNERQFLDILFSLASRRNKKYTQITREEKFEAEREIKMIRGVIDELEKFVNLADDMIEIREKTKLAPNKRSITNSENSEILNDANVNSVNLFQQRYLQRLRTSKFTGTHSDDEIQRKSSSYTFRPQALSSLIQEEDLDECKEDKENSDSIAMSNSKETKIKKKNSFLRRLTSRNDSTGINNSDDVVKQKEEQNILLSNESLQYQNELFRNCLLKLITSSGLTTQIVIQNYENEFKDEIEKMFGKEENINEILSYCKLSINKLSELYGEYRNRIYALKPDLNIRRTITFSSLSFVNSLHNFNPSNNNNNNNNNNDKDDNKDDNNIINNNNNNNNNNGSLIKRRIDNMSQLMTDRSRVVFQLKKLNQFNFNIFEFAEKTNNNLLSLVLPIMFQQLNIIKSDNKINVSNENFFKKLADETSKNNKIINEDITNNIFLDGLVLLNWIKHISKSFKNHNPFYNEIHSTSVIQNLYVFLTNIDNNYLFLLNKQDKISLILAACIQNFSNPGLNNNMLKLVNHEINSIYNGKDILENYHLSQAFIDLKNPKYNIFNGLNKDQIKQIRKNIISLVLLNAKSSYQTIKDYTDQLFDKHNNKNDISLKPEIIREKLRSILVKICYNHYYYSIPKINKEWSERKYQQNYIAQNLIHNEYQLDINIIDRKQWPEIEYNNMIQYKYIITKLVNFFKDDKLKNIKENFLQNLKYWDKNINVTCLYPSKPLEI